MDERNLLAERFEADRGRLRAVAYRMLGSAGEAEDAVQETWLRLSRTGGDEVENLGGWLTTVLARVCLDALRARRSRREDPLEAQGPEPAAGGSDQPDQELLLADSVGLALLVVLGRLGPAERVAFVLHDLFDVPFEQIAPIVGRTPAAARQLASRARRRVREGQGAPTADTARKRQLVEAFLAASRHGDFEALLALLDPEVLFRADAAAVRLGGQAEVRGADAVAALFKGRAQAARAALADGAMAIAVAPGGALRIVLRLEIRHGRIAAIEAVADPDRLARTEVVLFE